MTPSTIQSVEMIARTCSLIPPLDEAAMAEARARQNLLTKPQGSLGRLEALSIQLAGISGQPLPRLDRKAVIVLAGDHGIVAEGVSAYPAEVTAQMVLNFLQGGAAINVLARLADRAILMVAGLPVDLKVLPLAWPDQDCGRAFGQL